MQQLKNKKVLVTGGAGFIGSELVRQLAEAGAQVIVIDNLVNGKSENLAKLDSDKISLKVVDIRDKAALEPLLQDMDLVYHLACLGVRHSIHSPRENHEVNAAATLELLSLCREAGVSRFVCVSTSEVYGTALTAPMDEMHPTFPMTVYGSAKLAGECYARAYWRTYEYPTVVVRPFNTFGPRCHHEGDSGEVIPKSLLRCLAGKPLVVFGDGEQTRDFTYVADTARGILLAGTAPGIEGETINMGCGKEISINRLMDTIKEVMGRPQTQVIHDVPRPGDTLRLIADSQKARDLLGFTPQISFRQGLKFLLDWYQDQDASPEELLGQDQVHNWLSPEG